MVDSKRRLVALFPKGVRLFQQECVRLSVVRSCVCCAQTNGQCSMISCWRCLMDSMPGYVDRVRCMLQDVGMDLAVKADLLVCFVCRRHVRLLQSPLAWQSAPVRLCGLIRIQSSKATMTAKRSAPTPNPSPTITL